MLQSIWSSIRRRRAAILVLLSTFLALVYLSRSSSGERHATAYPTDEGAHRALLVTTPGNDEHPLHLIPVEVGGDSPQLGKAVPIKTGINPGSKQGVSHLVRHPSRHDVVYVNNEVRPGSVWTGRLEQETGGLKLGIFGQNPSAGDLPAYSLVSRDGQHLLVSNYGSPTVALYTIGSDGQIRHAQTVDLPRPTSLNADKLPHPHHIAEHPDQPVYYVPDLGLDVVFVLGVRPSRGPVELEVVQTFDTSPYGQGPRNGVVSADGRTYYLSFQTSSTVSAISLDRHGRLHSALSGAITTLPSEVHEEGITTSAGDMIHSSSDILLFDNLVLVANRRVKGPYPSYTGTAEDTIAVFETVGARLEPRGHIYTSCWKPREMMRVKTDTTKSYLAVTCNGQFAQGGGVVLIDMSEPYSVVDRWDSGRISVSGVVGLTVNYAAA